MGTEATGHEPNFMIREHACPHCGCYIWAHPITDEHGTVCHRTVKEAQSLYDSYVRGNNDYVRRSGG
jgi:hypothetical protein